MYQPATPVPGSPVSPLQLQAAGLLGTASELGAGLAPPRPEPVALPAWPALPSPPGWRGILAEKELAKRGARLAIYILLAPHLLSLASTVIGRADRPSLRPAIVAPSSLPIDQPTPVPTMTDGGVNYGG
jgi:hypothetical protein